MTGSLTPASRRVPGASARTDRGPRDRDGDPRQEIYLHPGQLAASASPTRVTTILGSCVAVCVYDPARAVGAMVHFILPRTTDANAPRARFGESGVRLVIQRVCELGGVHARLRAKIFGGACILEALRGTDAHVGALNVQIADALLETLGVPIVGRDVGGDLARKVVFHTDCGDVTVSRIPRS